MVAKCLFLCLTIFVYFLGSHQASLCYDTKSEWEDMCNKTYHGVVDGGRCFFTMVNVSNWNDSWKLCENRGASLAQIHTKGEFLRIALYLQSYFRTIGRGFELTWIALHKDPPVAAPPFIDLEKSYWFTNATNYDPKFKAGNTWVRNRKDDDWQCDGPCDVLWYYDQYRFGDITCSRLVHPLCVVTNSNQNFTMFHNECIAEEVLETFSTTDARSCGMKCASFDWCRGFNFRRDTNTCELFPWSLGGDIEADKPKSTSLAANCDAYSYLP